MNIDLKGKKALVTGSTSGIGFSIAKSLSDSGAEVYVNGRTEDRVQSAVADISKNGNKVFPAVGSVDSAEGIENIFKATGAEIDILVNNAGTFSPKPLLEISDKEWMKYFEFNLLSAIRLTRKYLPNMESKNWGRIISIASESAFNIPKEMVHYGVSKTALVAFTKGIALETAGTGITANSILPGPTHTDGVEDFIKDLYKDELVANPDMTFDELSVKFVKEQRPGLLIGRLITPQEVANLVVYVASDLSSATTGASLRVEGGILESL